MFAMDCRRLIVLSAWEDKSELQKTIKEYLIKIYHKHCKFCGVNNMYNYSKEEGNNGGLCNGRD